MTDEAISNDPAAERVVLRREIISEAVEATVAGMGEMGMSPAEALVAAELILWTFMENGMSGAPAHLVDNVKMLNARTLNRLVSRVTAWPAKTTERM